jgi:lipoprotein NlpI
MKLAQCCAIICAATIFTTTICSITRAAGDDHQICEMVTGDDASLAACTRAIASDRYKGHSLAILYKDRCDVYISKGNSDQAIADCTQAIHLDPKFAEAFNDRGAAYQSKKLVERAIADYTEAIRLDPEYGSAFSNRGAAYRNIGEFDKSLADLSEAIRLDPEDVDAYISRALTAAAKTDYGQAISDCSEAIRLDPSYSTAYYFRGVINVYGGTLSNAHADLYRATELDTTSAYAALWLDIVARRSHVPTRLAEASEYLDMKKWPAPIVHTYLGQLTPEVMLAAADENSDANKTARVCNAQFYAGELYLQQGNREAAARLFRLSAAGCPRTLINWWAARAELNVLGATP